MAVNNVTVANAEDVDDEVKLNQLSDDLINGSDIATNGDDIHKQYLGSIKADKADVATIVRIGQASAISLTVNFSVGGVEITSKSTTGFNFTLWQFKDGSGGSLFDESSATGSIAWNQAFNTGTYFVGLGLSRLPGGQFVVHAVGVEN